MTPTASNTAAKAAVSAGDPVRARPPCIRYSVLGRDSHRPPREPREPRLPVPLAVRVVLGRAQGRICPICGTDLDEREYRWTGDHVIPRSLKGPDGVGNLLAVHDGCNQAKGDRLPTGCELIWLLAVNARIGVQPQRWAA